MLNKLKATRGMHRTVIPNSKTRTAPHSISPSTLNTNRSGAYNSGVSEQVVEQKAADDGRGAILDPNTVGSANSHPHAAVHLTEGHEAATGIIGHDLRGSVQEIDESLSAEQENVKKTEAEALRAIGEHLSAAKRWLVQRQRMTAAGLPLPARKDGVWHVLRLVLLFVGDWSLIALGFQILSLSDRPWIPFLGFTDDLHLAALSSVAALVFLGDFTGYHLRRIEHSLELRRQADSDDREKLPKPAIFDYAWTLGCFAGALAGLFSLSGIREEYLRAMGVDANYWAFLGIQFIILAAAIALGFAHANPEAKRWKGVEMALNTADAKRTTTVAEHTEAAAHHNAMVDRREAIKAQAGHHVDTDAANVRGQHAAYKRTYITAQLEPVQEPLFAEHKVPTVHAEGDLLKRLTGITVFPVFNKVSTAKVMEAQDKALNEISLLRARIDQIEINKLDLPELEGLLEEIELTEAGAPAATATPLRPVPAQSTGDSEADENAEVLA